MLKLNGVIDDSGVPTPCFFEFLDQSKLGAVLADSPRRASHDLFANSTKAQELPVEQVKNNFGDSLLDSPGAVN